MKKTKWIQILILFILCLTFFVPSQTAQAVTKLTSVNKLTGKKTIYLAKGKKTTLKTTANGAVTYKSSNKKIATVTSKGVITAKKAGTAKITVALKKNKKQKTTVTVKVLSGKVTSVKLNKTSATLIIGETDKLTATVNVSKGGKKNVIWTSSNPKIATVNNGTIKAVAEGTATITVKATDGTGEKATCKVTVVKETKKDETSTEDKSADADTTDETDNPVIPTVSNEGNGTGKVDVTWTAVSGATGYMIYRNTAAGTKITTDKIITTIASTGESSYSYTDTSCTTGVKYYYKIQSLKNGKVLSTQKFESVATEIEIIRTFNQKEAYKMLALVNAYRTSQGVGTLTWNNTLEKAAMVRSLEQSIILGHERPNGGWNDVYEDGEDIMIGSSIMTAEQCMAQWDVYHLQDIVYEDYTQMGAAFCDGSIVLTFYSNSTINGIETELRLMQKDPNRETSLHDGENFLKYVKCEAEWDGLIDAKGNPTELAKTKYTVIEK